MHTTTTALWVRAVNHVRAGRDRVDERGLTTTEVAVLTFVLVGIAIAIGAVLFQYANDTVTDARDSTPDLVVPEVE